MKKLTVIMVAVLAYVLLLSGCTQQNSALPYKNNAGTQSVSIPDKTAPTQEKATPDNSALSNNAPALVGKSEESSSQITVLEKDVVEIREKMFIAQTNDIYINPADYLGKTIKLEGIFDIFSWEKTNTTYYSVIRYGPGCCGYDANAGFEVDWDGDYPDQNDWVEAVGVLESYEENGQKYLLLRLTSLKVLPTRGAEYVYQ